MAYKIEGKTMYRDNEPIAELVGGELDFLEGMARFRAPAVRFLKQYKKEVVNEVPNVDDTAKSTDAVDAVVEAEKPEGSGVPVASKEIKKEKKKVENKTSKPSWLVTLSEIAGETVEMPHPRNGWRLKAICGRLKLKYNEIVKSERLSSDEKKAILNQIM